MAGSWQAEERGEGQLRELGSMVRSQVSLWGNTFALFMVANAILVFSYHQQEGHYLARTAISLVALAVNGSLLLVLMQAQGRLDLWTKNALALESDLGVPQQFRVWGDNSQTGVQRWKVGQLTASALLVYWGVCLGYAAVSLLL